MLQFRILKRIRAGCIGVRKGAMAVVRENMIDFHYDIASQLLKIKLDFHEVIV